MTVREKLKIINDLYPEEKLNIRKERWRRMWLGEPLLDRYPFLFYPAKVDYYNTVYDKETRLNLFLDEFIFRGNLEEDFIPTHMYGWSWIPENTINASISADCLAMLSSSFFTEHYLPYIRELGRYFGGLIIHSCGDFSAVVKSLTKIPEIKAVNASQMTPQMLYESGWDPEKVIITKEDFDKSDEIFGFIKDKNLKVELCIRELWKTGDKGLALNPDEWTVDTWKRIRQNNFQIIQYSNFQ